MSGKESGVEVKELRQILIWPLYRDTPIEEHGKRPKLPAPWEKIDDPLLHLKTDDEYARADAYAEFVYFHGAIQTLLYGSSQDSALELFRRPDIVEMTAKYGDKTHEFTVERCHFYRLTDFSAAALVVEVSHTGTLSLPQTMTLLDTLRRTFPPFWAEDNTGQRQAGSSPTSVHWRTTRGTLEQAPPLTLSHAYQSVKDKRQIPLFPHWLAALGLGDDRGGWLPAPDERIPVMAWLAVDHPKAITQGDWVRLALLDSPSDCTDLPYGTRYLEDFQQKHCYDAFWDPNAGKTTRYLLSGYSLVAVGGTDDNFFKPHVETHIRRHYFQIGLIAHLQIAALFSLSERLAKADLKNHDQASALQQAALNFTNKLWFTDLSSHVQGRDLFSRWRHLLGTEALYEQVMRKAADNNQFLKAEFERRSTEAASTLNTIALIGLSVSIAIGFLGMNVFVPQSGKSEFTLPQFPIFLLTLTIVFIMSLCGFRARKPLTRWLSLHLDTTIGVMIILSFILLSLCL